MNCTRVVSTRTFVATVLILCVSACSNLSQQSSEPVTIPTPDPVQAPDPVQTPEPVQTSVPAPPQECIQRPAAVAKPCDCPVAKLPAFIIGEVEYALLGEDGLLQKARIDTGATTSSIDIADTTLFERDGDKWLRFTIQDRLAGCLHTFERRILRIVDIKGHGDESDRRPVVAMNITIGEITHEIEVTLADRSAFEFPVLIGRNFLYGNVLVDVSQRYIATALPEK